MRGVGRRLYSRARGAGSTFPPTATVETGCRYAYNLFGYLYQTNSTMQHNLQLEMGGEQDMDSYCSLLFQKLCASEAQLPVAGSSLMSNQAVSSWDTSS